MKKLLIAILFVTVSVATFAQGFFRPIDRSLLKVDATTDRDITVDQKASVWLFRPSVTLSAMQFFLTNPVEVASLSSLGTGVSYQNIVLQNDKPYTRFGVNALVLFTQSIGDIEPVSLSFAATVQTLNFINVGLGYSLGRNKVFILTGVSFSFN